MKTSRRDFIRKSSLFGSVTFAGTYPMMSSASILSNSEISGNLITLELPKNKKYFKPLERIDLVISELEKGMIKVFDGRGNQYHSDDVRGRLNFKVGGFLGYHSIQLIDQKEKLVDQIFFPVNGETEINDTGGEFREMLDFLKWPLLESRDGLSHSVRYNNKNYRLHSGQLSEDVLSVNLALKYFLDLPVDTIDLFGDGQGSDGLIYDNYQYSNTSKSVFRNEVLKYSDFFKSPEDSNSSCFFLKNSTGYTSQYTFIAGLYHTWRDSGDDAWMQKHLDTAVKAIESCSKSTFFWSGKYQLLRRPFSPDMWDLKNKSEEEIIKQLEETKTPDKIKFGIHSLDNISFSYGCEILAEMLDYSKNESKATTIRKLGQNVRTRINKLAWNGSFFLHFIPEDGTVMPDLGVDPEKQVSMSNAFSLNLGTSHEQCASILRTYQRISKQLPEDSPGEWYSIFPPYEESVFNIKKWHMLNGGVLPSAAGQLAKGAFENGMEEYGIDILRRTSDSFKFSEKSLEGIYDGADLILSNVSDPINNLDPFSTSRAAALLTNTIIEDLAGVQNSSSAFNYAILSPKWEAAGIESANAMIKLENSGGYLAYKYKMIEAENKLIIEFTSNAQLAKVRLLIPKDKQLKGVYCDREMFKYIFKEVQDSEYAEMEIKGVGVHIVEARFA